MSTHSVSLNELFGNVVKSLWSIAIFMTAECEAILFLVFRSKKNVDSLILIVLERAHLEFKVSAQMTYFKSLQQFLEDSQQSKPSPPEQSRRVTNLPDLSPYFSFYLTFTRIDEL